MENNPASHPSQNSDAEYDKGGDVEHGVEPILWLLSADPSYDEQLTHVQEDAVHLHEESHHGVPGN